MNIISDINDKRIELYSTLKYTPKSHTLNKVFIAEGEKIVEKLLRSNFEILSIFAVEEFHVKYSTLLKDKNISEEILFSAEKNLMSQIVGYKLHSGVMAIAKQPESSSIDELKSPIFVLNRIINSENVGAIVRNCAAFGVKSIIVDNETSSPYMRRAVRVSMGHVLDLKVHFSEDIIKTIKYLKNQRNFKIFSAEVTENSIDIKNVKFDSDFGLVLGSEGYGIEKNILELSDAIIKIPINSKVPSINVAGASAIFLYEISKQSNIL
jgi:tRNA G18 (ribose-2'-O)-methylase SpoU